MTMQALPGGQSTKVNGASPPRVSREQVLDDRNAGGLAGVQDAGVHGNIP
jgi:hypothetical protein